MEKSSADIGRFFNVDPLADKYFYNSPYAFSENKVTSHLELEGLEAVDLNDPEQVNPQASEGPSVGTLLSQAAEVFGIVMGFHFGDGNDGSAESAAALGNAIDKAPIITEEVQALKEETRSTFDAVPGLNSALSVMDASQAKTNGETLQYLIKAAWQANSIPVTGAPKGAANPKVASAIKTGNQAHVDFSIKVTAKGWTANPRLTDPVTGKTVIPDAVTGSGKPVELKPNTQSGRAKRESQLPKYERATGQRGRVVYYDPNKQQP